MRRIPEARSKAIELTFVSQAMPNAINSGERL
jgi:hypothetical protein